MYSPEEMERDREERHWMAVRDDIARRQDAWKEGFKIGYKEGLQQGRFVVRVRLCESLLNRPVSNKDMLYEIPLDKLKKRADELEREVRASESRSNAGNQTSAR